jgi:hypothetical protein
MGCMLWNRQNAHQPGLVARGACVADVVAEEEG